MGYYAKCSKCQGSGRFYDSKSGKTFECRACGGSGSNKSLYESSCERCRRSIISSVDQPTPRFCKNCRNEELEKRCEQYGCDHTIRYKVGWNDVPRYCKRCQTKRNESFTASTCPGVGWSCGKLIWSPPGKTFKLCPECSQKERAAKESQWKTKQCKSCSNDIRYHIEWTKIPDYCQKCLDWQKKPCGTTGCYNTIQYKKFWENIPNLCEDCRKKNRERKEGEHSTPYKRARKEFMRRSLNDPNVASRIKEWIRQEIATRGEDGYWRSPPGFDVGHIIPGLDAPENFRWENADMNRSRGAKSHR
jgi:hypothetical protein